MWHDDLNFAWSFDVYVVLGEGTWYFKKLSKKVPSGIFSLFLEVYFLMQSEEEETMHHMAASFRLIFFIWIGCSLAKDNAYPQRSGFHQRVFFLE